MTSLKKHRKLKKPIKIALLISLLMIIGIPIGFISAVIYEEINHENAFTLYIDNEAYFTLSTKAEVDQLVQDYLLTYKSDIASKHSDAIISAVQNLEIVETRIENGDTDNVNDAKEMLNQIEDEANIYTVVQGDNLWNIAIDNNIPLSQIIKYNPSIDPDKIWPNDEILFVPANPMIDVSVRYELNAFEDVLYPTEYIYDDSLFVSQRIVVQKGMMGKKLVSYEVKELNGYEEDRFVLQETQLFEPTKAIIRVGTKRTLTRTSSSNFGVTSGRFTSSYGWRIHPITGVRTFHDGIDIANSSGTSVYAYTDGTVVTVGFDSYFGRYIVLNHGGGLTTIYKHLRAFNVSLGQSVRVGDKIGFMGSTGFSTGNHLHFEVRQNGSTRNPLDYI